MRVIGFVRREESGHGVVSRQHKASKVGEELTAQVEDNKEEVEGAQADHAVDLGDRGLLLQVVESRVLGQLPWFQVSTGGCIRGQLGCVVMASGGKPWQYNEGNRGNTTVL